MTVCLKIHDTGGIAAMNNKAKSKAKSRTIGKRQMPPYFPGFPPTDDRTCLAEKPCGVIVHCHVDYRQFSDMELLPVNFKGRLPKGINYEMLNAIITEKENSDE